MNYFWTTLGRGLVKAAIWCLDHPDQVIAVVQAVKAKQ